MASKKGTTGPAGILYLVLMLLCGVLAWFFFQGKTQDRYEASIKFDNALVDLLVADGVSNSDITAQSRSEHAEGPALWIESYKEITLPASIDADTIAGRVKDLAAARGLSVIQDETAAASRTVAAGMDGKVFSRVVFRRKPAAAAPSKRLAIVIDDVGFTNNFQEWLSSGVPLTFAVMPFERHSREISAELSGRKIPFIMHLPMEPVAYPAVDPGKAALFVRMTGDEIRAKFEKDLATVPGASGVSNHMGSRFTADEGKLDELMPRVKAHGLFYFDSVTTQRSRVAASARKAGVRYLENSIFLDNDDSFEAVTHQLEIALKLARRRGACAIIGHITKKNTLPAIRAFAPKFAEAGITLVYLPDLLDTPR